MHKGVATRYLVFMILGIIVFASMMFFAIAYGPGWVDMAMQIVYGLTTPEENGEQFREELIEAIKCSHYRCTDGCTKAINMVDYDTFSQCAVEFCTGETIERCDTNGDKKICGDEAEECPITLTVSRASISKESLKDIITCVVTDDSWWDPVGATYHNFVYLEKDLLDNIERESCKYTVLGTGVNDAITEAEVSGSVVIESYIGFPPVENGPQGNRLHTITTTVKKVSCIDTDGGNNKLIKGTCTDSFGSYTESCWSTTEVVEYMCNPEGTSCIGLVDLNCPSDAPVCVDGACITTTTTTSPPESCDELGGNCIARGICDIEPDLGCISSSDCTGPNCCCVPIIIVP